jgi:hypothetical protein
MNFHLSDELSASSDVNFNLLFSTSLDKLQIELFTKANQTAANFFRLIQSRPGEYILFSELIETGFTVDEILKLSLVVACRLGFDVIRLSVFENPYLVYTPYIPSA